MIKATIQITETPGADLLGIKEALLNYCEQFGDIKLTEFEEVRDEQIKFDEVEM